jgi:hypothetical protein
MANYRLSRDVTVNFREYQVSAKAGAPVTVHKDGSGADLFAIDPAFCDAGSMGKAGTWSIFGHDSEYHHVWVSADAVEAVE